jgi:hypothetical protein
MGTGQDGNERVEDNESVASELSRESLVDSLVEDMREALNEVKCLGTFAKHSYVDREVAGVYINGVGRIQLPLQEGQARQIIGQLFGGFEILSMRFGLWSMAGDGF